MTAADLLTEAGQLLSQQGVADSVIETVIHELRWRYGGDRVFIQKIDRQRRNQAIAADLAVGMSPEVVARRRQCGSATVYRVRHTWQL